jgi:signal transduction histidine kinase
MKTEKAKKMAETRNNKPSDKRAGTALRKRAESLIKKRDGNIKAEPVSVEEAQRLIHELRTHQIELEMQNEELRNTQLSLEDARKKYTDLYDFAPVGYFTFDNSGIVREANLTGASMLEVERSRLIGKPFVLYIKGKSPEADCRTIFNSHIRNVLKTGEWQNCEVEVTRQNDTVFFAALESVLATDNTVRTTISDITERKQAAEALKISNEALKKHTSELESVNKELEAFSYVVSHDLKAPVRHMEGFAKILLEDYGKLLDNTGRDYLDRIVSAGERMSELIEALLTMARQTGTDLRVNAVNLSSLAEATASELKTNHPDRKVEFVIRPAIKTEGDLVMLRTVIVNLLENAWKFTSKQPSATIEFGVTKGIGEDSLVYFVRDNGAGFDMAYAEKLFKPFGRLHKESEYKGLGIGLAIVDRIVRRHGGKVWAEGKPGEGATFYFTLGENKAEKGNASNL